MFEFLFLYPADWFARGSIELGVEPWVFWTLLLSVVALAIWLYTEPRTASWRWRILLGGCRIAAMALVVWCLCQPMLVVTNPVPGRSFVAVLIDDSRSMRIADANADTRPRYEAIVEALDPRTGPLYRALAEPFELRLFRFGNELAPLDSLDSLTFDQGRSDLVGALDETRERFSGSPLSAIVVISDGADNSDADIQPALLALRARGTAVYTLGVGQPTPTRDIELEPLQLPEQLVRGSSAQLSVTLHHAGYAGERVQVIAETDDRWVAEREIVLDGRATTQVLLPIAMDRVGPQPLRVRVAGPADEPRVDNNVRVGMIDVVDRRERILYVEGEPRFDMKFIRRAASHDPNIDLVGLLRTAESKFYRVGIHSPDELSNGFPTTREDLFAYRALIIGNVEAAFFTTEQQRLIRDFVAERGGGLLYLGGKNALAQGGYGRSELADLLPVSFDERDALDAEPIEARLEPTESGEAHSILSMVGDSANEKIQTWRAMPALTIVNPIDVDALKPGAQLLMRAEGARRSLVGLAVQRYGRGRVLTFPVQNAWLWKMHPDLPWDDRTHEIFWQRLLRWMSAESRERTAVRFSDRLVSPGERVEIELELLDAEYRARENAQARLLMITPTGGELNLEVVPDPTRPGLYRSAFIAEQTGTYELQVQASERATALDDAARDGELPESSATATALEALTASEGPTIEFVEVDANAREPFAAERRDSLLEAVARDANGEFHTLDDPTGWIDRLADRQTGSSLTERHPLWSMPIVLLVLLGLLSVEWLVRRWRGLA